MSELFKIRIACDTCRNIFEAWVTAKPNPDKQDWYRGFICANCIRINKNKQYWERLANSD